MANMRVHELAKEFGMENKELLEHLQALKIPAKSHSSTLQDAYIDMIRLKLKPVLKERAAQIEAAKKAEQERLEAEEREAAMQAEKERLEAEERARLRREEEARRKKEAEEAAAAEARAREEEERLRREEEERNRIKDTAPTVSKSYDSLLDKIAAEESRMAQEREQKQEARKQEARKPKERQTPAPLPVSEPSPSKGSKRKKGKKESVDIEERKPRRDQESERFVKSKVLAEAREAVLRARDTEDTGRRKKRKEKRAKEEAERREKEAIEQAKAQGINPAELGTVRISEGSTVAEVAEAIGVAPNDIIKRLFLLGTPLTLTQSMSNDLIELVASDLEVEVKILTPQEEATFTFYDEPDTLLHRPPVVTVMGHVDHGKTSLLDAIRQTGVVKSEAGGITQHIGASIAYINNKQITFIDTPGHEAFTAMRARGAKITDIVILVVAADDGVMPQTIEAINHSKAAGVPVIVAVNKCDKPSANPERVRKELVDHGVIPEDWGGDNMFVDVSAKKEMGIDDLLESVLLQAEVLELKANPNTFASGYVIEAKLDKGRGPVATMLVNRGTLRVGDAVVAGTSYGRVRALLGPNGEHLSEITPANPAEVLGLDSVPAAGDEFRVFEDERDARALAEERSFKQRLAAQNRTKKHVTLETLFDHVSQEELKDLNIIVKADVQGSIEALADALSKMDQSEVRINIIHAAVGGVTETDVSLATASNAIIIGFNVRPSRGAKDAAEKEDVEIRTYRVIYQAIDDINAARVGMLAPTIEERDTGVAEVRETFKVPRVGTIGGCYITEGEIARDNKIRVVRNGAVVFEGTLASLKRFKEDVKSVRAGYECGIGVEGYQDIKVGDLIEGYEVVEVARKE